MSWIYHEADDNILNNNFSPPFTISAEYSWVFESFWDVTTGVAEAENVLIIAPYVFLQKEHSLVYQADYLS